MIDERTANYTDEIVERVLEQLNNNIDLTVEEAINNTFIAMSEEQVNDCFITTEEEGAS